MPNSLPSLIMTNYQNGSNASYWLTIRREKLEKKNEGLGFRVQEEKSEEISSLGVVYGFILNLTFFYF